MDADEIEAINRQMRAIAMSRALCPGCGHPLEQHDEEGCCWDDRALLYPDEVTCRCLLSPAHIQHVFRAWAAHD